MAVFPLQRDQRAQAAIEELPAAEHRELGIRGFGQIRIHGLRRAGDIGLRRIEWPARVDAHGADAAFGHLRGRRLDDVDARDEFHRQIAEVDGAIARRHRQRQRRGAVDLDADQVGLGAAHADAAALAFLARDLHAGHALQRLAQILVGEVTDVLGRDRVDDLRRVAFCLERIAQARANAGDHDGLDVFGIRRSAACHRPVPAPPRRQVRILARLRACAAFEICSDPRS